MDKEDIEFLTEEPEEIKEYYIGYFDILGYKQYFCEFGDNKYRIENYLKKFHNSIKDIIKDVILKYRKCLKNLFMDIKIKIFSDNFLICLEASNAVNEIKRLLVFIQLLADIQRDFILKFGLFVRGGITKGDISLNNCYVFGKGLIDVVNLENTAKYPKIVISNDLLEFINRNIFSKNSISTLKIIIETLKKDTNFFNVFVDYIYPEFLNIDNTNFLTIIYYLIGYLDKKFYTLNNCDRFLSIFKEVINGKKLDENSSFFYKIFSDYINFKYDFLIYKLLDFDNDNNDCFIPYIYRINLNELFGQEIYNNCILYSLEKLDPKNFEEVQNEKLLDIPEILEKHSEIVKENLKKNKKNEKILEKYLWVKKYHNKMCIKYNFLNLLLP